MIHKFLQETAYKKPDKLAIIQGQRRVTYGELDIGVSQLASFLINGEVKVGDRVCIMSDGSPEYVISYFGAQKAGGISVSINPQSSTHELKWIFSNCLPVFLIVERKYLKSVLEAIDEETSLKSIIVIGDRSIEESLPLSNNKAKIPSHINILTIKTALERRSINKSFPSLDGENIASIIYTSGTTGRSKGVTLSHGNYVYNANSIIKYLSLTMDDSVMVVLPFFYSYGASLLTTHIMVGGLLVLENSFMYPNVILDKMVSENVTGFAGVPSTYAILLNRSNIRNYRFPKLRYMTLAGGPMSPKHVRELAEVLPGTEIFIMYGQTEATARLTYLRPQDLFRKPGSIGKAIPGVEIELVKENGELAKEGEDGEIVAKGGNVMVGYWKNQEETDKVLRNGKLHTGDIAKADDEGYIYITSRRSDMIKSGSHRISPKEIEEVIIEMPEIHEVVVVGVDDDILGDAIKAIVVLKDGCRLETKEVQRHCKQNLAPFKIPKEVVFVDELPKTSSGKVQKYLLRKED